MMPLANIYNDKFLAYIQESRILCKSHSRIHIPFKIWYTIYYFNLFSLLDIHRIIYCTIDDVNLLTVKQKNRRSLQHSRSQSKYLYTEDIEITEKSDSEEENIQLPAGIRGINSSMLKTEHYLCSLTRTWTKSLRYKGYNTSHSERDKIFQ